MIFNKNRMILTKLLVFCFIFRLSYERCVCGDILNLNPPCDNDECNVFSHLNVQLRQERRLRSPKLNFCASTVDRTLNYHHSKDSLFQLNTIKRNRIGKKNDFQSKSTHSHPKTASKRNARLSCTNSYSPSALISTNDQKCKLSDIAQSSIDYFNDDFSIFYYGSKSLLLAIKRRFNGIFAYIIISTITFMSLTIILMDVFKYGFNIGSSRKKHQRLKQQYRTNYLKQCQPTIIRRRTLFNISKLPTIPEEDEIESYSSSSFIHPQILI